MMNMEKLQCRYCDKKFDTEQSLRQHENDKHTSHIKTTIQEKTDSRHVIKFKKIYILVILVLILIISIVSYLFFFPKVTYVPLKEHIENSLGLLNSSVVMVEYSDFQCPYCKKVEPTVKQVIEEYGDRIKIVYKHFPLTGTHKYSWKAAEAAECADDQGKFWEMHDKLFENQQALDINSLKKYAEELELNTTLFNQCLDSGVMSVYVKRDFEEGQNSGVIGTPTFFIGDQKISGSQSFHAFENAIESELAKA